MSDITNEIKKRRTFAIISHPDAGKTTLTEKFLLYGEVSQLHRLCCSLITADIVSISWIHRDIRTSRRTRTVP